MRLYLGFSFVGPDRPCFHMVYIHWSKVRPWSTGKARRLHELRGDIVETPLQTSAFYQ
jgi:hypothetical protein